MRRSGTVAIFVATIAAACALAGGGRTASPALAQASSEPDCPRRNVAASTLSAAEPNMPALAEQRGIAGTVQVIVALDEQSRLVSARIQSSPSALLNEAALDATRRSRFQTEIRDCRTIAARFIYTVDFVRSVPQPAFDPNRTVTVESNESVSRPPDMAYVAATVSARAADPFAAEAETAATVARIVARLRALHVDDAKVRDTVGGTYPARTATASAQAAAAAREPGGQYVATRRVVVTADGLADVAAVATALGSGEPTVRVNLRYDLRDREGAYRAALAAAVKGTRKEALDRAAARSVALGTVGAVVVSSDQDDVYTERYVPVSLPQRAGTPVTLDPPAPVDVSASATVTYLLGSVRADRVIIVDAFGDALRMPDVAYVSVRIATQGDDSATVAAGNAASYEGFVGRLGASAHIDPASLRTTYSEPYGAPAGAPHRYLARRSVLVTVPDFARVRQVVEAVAATDAVRVGYDTRDREGALSEAIARAQHDARERADVVAAALGVRVGAVAHTSSTRLGAVTGDPYVEPLPAQDVRSVSLTEPVPIVTRAYVMTSYAIEPSR